MVLFWVLPLVIKVKLSMSLNCQINQIKSTKFTALLPDGQGLPMTLGYGGDPALKNGLKIAIIPNSF